MTGNLKGPNAKSKRRAEEYKICQQIYKKNRRALAEAILNNDSLLSPPVTPSLAEIEGAYKEIFQSLSPADERPFEERWNETGPKRNLTIKSN